MIYSVNNIQAYSMLLLAMVIIWYSVFSILGKFVLFGQHFFFHFVLFELFLDWISFHF